jgi:hypothetical protein
MSERQHDLVTDEGVDEGSAAMSAEGDAGPDVDAVGPSATGRPRNDEQDAAPEPIEADEPRRDGQQLAAGEG